MKKHLFKFKWVLVLSTILLLWNAHAYATPTVRGFMNSWSCTEMTQIGSTGVYYYTATSNGEFKVQDGCNWDDDKKLSYYDNSLGNVTLSGKNDGGSNISCSQGGTWYIVYNGSKVYATTVNPDAPSTYTVTYDGNGKTGGSVPEDANNYSSGATVIVKGNTGSLVKTGCVFDGWMTAQDGSGTTYAPGATFSISGNTTLYARWIAKTIYVYDNLSWNTMKLYTFNSNRNGGWPGTVATSLGSKWYRIDILDGASQFIVNNKSGDSGSQSVDLNTSDYTAGRSYETYNDGGIKLREKTFTVSFNMKSHGSEVSSQNIYYNGLVTEPSPAPSATGYTFGGWYKETGCTNVWNFGSDRITAARTLYAKWTAKNYSITYNLNGGTQQVSPAPATSYTIESSAITLPTPSKDGCNFDGWFDNSSFTGSAITTIAAGSAGNKEYWAKWSTASTYYDVTFGVHASGHGTLAAVKTATSAAITSGDDLLSGTAITFTATPSSYYEVDAWYTNSACTTGEHDVGETTYSVASLGSDIVVYVKFKPTTYTITYNLNSGTNNPGNPSTYTYESSAITLQDPTRDGYTFGGWYTEVGLVNRVYSIAAGSNGNKAFWAKWTEKKSTVTVNANQTSMGTLKFGETSKSWGTTASVGVTTTQNITATANSGYVFDRWVLSGGATTSSSLTSATITLKGNGTGADGIAKAVFGKKYYYRGGKNSWNATQMTCHESGYYAYYSASSGEHEFKITPNSDNYTDACNTFDNSYGNITLTHKDDGYGDLNVKCPGATAHYICILYPNTAVNDGANPLIFASTTLPDLAPETTYATTFYAGNHGAINAKGTAIAKNGNASVNIGATARALTATPESGYSFDKWVTTGSVTVTDPYSASTTVSASAAGGTVTATYLQNSGWYLQGGFDDYDTWETSAKALPVDRPYRGISGVYYRPFSTLDNGDYFGMHDGTNKYSGHTATDKNYDYNSLDQVATLYVNSSQSFQAKTSFSNKWAVIKTTDTKIFWIQNPETCHTVTVSNDGNGTKGTVVLKTSNHGNLATYQYANNETIRVEIDTVEHYSIASVTLGSTPVSMSHYSGTQYVGEAVMPNNDVTLTVTYTPWYQVKLAASPAAAADAPTAAKTTGGATVAHNSYVLSGTSVTFTKQTANEGYIWNHWENNSSSVGTGNTYVTTISAATTITAVYTLNNHAITHSDASHGSYTIQVGSAAAVSTSTTSDYGKTITLAATPATGYHFGSWSAYKTGTPATTITVTSNQFTMPDYAVTVGATFSPTTYSITYNTNGGSAIPAGSYNIETATFALPTTSEKTGYIFAGWYNNAELEGDAVSSITVGSYGNKEYWAKWTPNTYTVSFDVNGGTASKPDDKEVTYDAAYGTLPSGMTHTSKQFIGWYTDPDDGEGDLITAETIVSTASDHTLYAHYENVYSVNVNFKCGEASIYPSTSVEASPTSLRPTITAPEVFGYSFENWTGTNVTFADASSATTTITATAATSVTANYEVVPTVYFKNNLGWENVYVTFDNEWSSSAPTNYGKPYFQMTQIGSSDIYYCVIPSAYTASDYASWAWNIAFDNTGFESSENEGTHSGGFNTGEFTGRGDFDPRTTMFIPYNGETETRNGGTFYTTGCWIQYNSTYSGYKVKVNSKVQGGGGTETVAELRSNAAGSTEFTATANLTSANYTYGVMLYKDYQKNTADIWFTNVNDEEHTITAETTSLPWAFYKCDDSWQRCRVKTEALGDYKITVSFATGKPMVDIEYPVTVGDWKLIYKDLATWSDDAHTASWCHPSRVIKAKADAEDIVSFFVAYGSTPSIELHKCTAINPSTGAQTWTKQSDVSLTGITQKGIYNFKVSQNGSKEATVTLDGEYDGNFYIRTDASDGGWTNYKTSGKNLMTYSEYSLTHGGDFGPYSHYFMRFASKGTNIKFCIANDYSEAITDTVVSDTYTNEYIDADGNVRFMWNSGTNKIGRTYISGSTVVSDRFLVLEGDEQMFDESGNELTTAGGGKISGLNDYEMKFTDDQNWIYETTVKAQPGARIKLTAKYNDKIQYFYGEEGERSDATTDLLIGGSGDDKYKMRIVYDFKTNRLMRAFIPDGTITTDLAINADMMIIREHQEDAQQISFSEDGALSEVKTVYGAMKFNKYTVNAKEKTGGHAGTGASRYERDLFYISFPFDVKLGDVFGFGTYGKHWIIEYYDGKGRAEKGFWADSDPNWKFVMPAQRNSFTMKAFEGYILALELDEMTESSSVWDNGVEDVYVYFPSDGNVNNIKATNRQITIDQTGYECTINRNTPDGNRTVKDSYWHCIGVPSFADYSRDLTVTDGGATIDWSDDDGVIDWTTPSLPYLYEWNRSNNTLSVTSSATFSFKATWSYLVQYAGTSIYWSQVNVTPASIVARKRTAPTSAEFRIELQKDGQKADQTFVRLTEEENVTTGFDFNYDLSKEFNKNKPNIYSLVTTVKEGVASVTQSAANVLPMTEQTAVIPVGVKIATAGDYTFAIPEGTNGVGVTLIDNETGVRTSLSALDYTVNLSAGTYDERFVLEISPIMQTPTGIEQIGSDDANGARKMLIDGVLYIVKDGKIFDAQGRQVK